MKHENMKTRKHEKTTVRDSCFCDSWFVPSAFVLSCLRAFVSSWLWFRAFVNMQKRLTQMVACAG